MHTAFMSVNCTLHVHEAPYKMSTRTVHAQCTCAAMYTTVVSTD